MSAKKKMCSLFGQLPNILKECFIHQSLGPLTRISPPALSIASTNGVNEGRLTPKDNQSVTVEGQERQRGWGRTERENPGNKVKSGLVFAPHDSNAVSRP